MECKKCAGPLPGRAAFCPWCGARQAPAPKAAKRRGNGQGSAYRTRSGRWQAELCVYAGGERLRHTRGGFASKKEALAYLERQGGLLRAALGRQPVGRQGFGALAKLLDALLLPGPQRPLSGAALARLPLLQALLADPAHRAQLPAPALAQLESAGWAPPQRPAFPLARAWQLFLQSQRFARLSADKKSHYRTAWARLAPLWGQEMAGLRFAQLQAAVDAAPGGFYPKRDLKTLLGHLYRVAVREEAVAPEQDRVKYIELPGPPVSRRETFRPEEIAALWQDYRAGHQMAGYALEMIYTGMRPGELRQVRREDVHLKEQYLIGGIKTETGRNRVIPLPDLILPVIRSQLKDSRGRLVALREEAFYDGWARMVRRTGIRPLPPYCCRHTAATALNAAGVDQAVIMAILGHRSYDTTLIYTHISPERKVAAANAAAPGGTGG